MNRNTPLPAIKSTDDKVKDENAKTQNQVEHEKDEISITKDKKEIGASPPKAGEIQL